MENQSLGTNPFCVGEEVVVNADWHTHHGIKGKIKEIIGRNCGVYYEYGNRSGTYWWDFTKLAKLVKERNDVKNKEPLTEGQKWDVSSLLNINHFLGLIKTADPEDMALTSLDSNTNSLGGKKNDQNKIDYTLLLKDLPESVKSVVKVLEFGSKRYGRTNYSKVETERYEAAMLRHAMAYLSGELLDPETEEPHLSHLVCCAMFLIERQLKDKKEENN